VPETAAAQDGKPVPRNRVVWHARAMVVVPRSAVVDSISRAALVGPRFLAFVVECHPFAWGAARKAWAKCGVETRDPDALLALGATVARAIVEELPSPDRDLPETQPFVDAGTRFAEEVTLLARDVDGFFAREALAASITDDEKRWMLRGIILTRAVDNKMKQLFLSSEMTYGERGFQGKGFRSLGQEAIYAAALRLRRGRAYERMDVGTPGSTPGSGWAGDVAGPLIRDLGFTLAFVDDTDDGVEACLNAQVGKAGPPHDGRDLHLAYPSRGILMVAAPLTIATGTVTGAALAFARTGQDRVAVSFIGEGGSSLGEWHESINLAAVKKLPVIFCLENNQTALSTPLGHQSRTRTFAEKARGYGIPGVTIDGTDAIAVAAAFAWAAERARSGLGPTLIETVAMRMCGHAHHDDMLYLGGDPPLTFEPPPVPDKGYVDRAKYAAWLGRDPLARLAHQLKAAGVVDDRQVLAWQAEAMQRVDAATATLKTRPWADGATAGRGVFGGSVVVHGPALAVPSLPSSVTTPSSSLRMIEEGPAFHPKGATFLDACGHGLLEVMDARADAFVLGEDVAPPYGNAFLLLKPLLEKHGDRLLNTPIAEGAIIGACVGAALSGLRPIGEIQFNDFVASGFNQLVNNAAKLRYRAGTPVPMTLRMPWGGLRRAGPYHSQDTSPWFFRTPGLKIVAPSTPHDARALLWSAVADDDPVLFYEHIALYRDPRIKQVLPEKRPTIPLGTAAFRRLGDDLTIVSYGAYVHKACAAADALAADGITCDVLDLRSLVPLDWARIEASVKHTGKVLLVGEDSRTGSILESIASRLGESLYEHLDGPVRVLGSLDTPVPYSPSLEDAFLLSDDHILATARALATW
jgi:2-oxoisovalerate dehydrogenase E1 component